MLIYVSDIFKMHFHSLNIFGSELIVIDKSDAHIFSIFQIQHHYISSFVFHSIHVMCIRIIWIDFCEFWSIIILFCGFPL